MSAVPGPFQVPYLMCSLYQFTESVLSAWFLASLFLLLTTWILLTLSGSVGSVYVRLVPTQPALSAGCPFEC